MVKKRWVNYEFCDQGKADHDIPVKKKDIQNISLFICRMKYKQPVVQNVKLQTASRVEFWTAMYVYGEHDSQTNY